MRRVISTILLALQILSAQPEIRKLRDNIFNAMSMPAGPDSPIQGVTMSVSIESMPELPYEKADSILVGTVRSAQAFQSGNRGAVYTEFQVSVDELLSTNAPSVIKPESEIAILQIGGKVKLEDGRIFAWELSGIGKHIEVGKKYLFFLNTRLAAKCAQITKTWDLTGGKATPMNPEDFARANRGESEFAGMNADLFLTMARREAAKRKPFD